MKFSGMPESQRCEQRDNRAHRGTISCYRRTLLASARPIRRSASSCPTDRCNGTSLGNHIDKAASGFHWEVELRVSEENPSQPAWEPPVLRDRAVDTGSAEEAHPSPPTRPGRSAALAKYRSKDSD